MLTALAMSLPLPSAAVAVAAAAVAGCRSCRLCTPCTQLLAHTLVAQLPVRLLAGSAAVVGAPT